MATEDRPFPAVLDRVRPRDALDLMAWPWFSLAKAKRVEPVAFEQGGQYLRISSSDRHQGLATIWDADVLIWAVSQLTEGRDQGLRVSRRLAAPPYQILRYLGRGTAQRQYVLLGAALDRLAATTVDTTLRAPSGGASVRFRLLDDWHRTSSGIEFALSEWLFAAVVTDRRVLTIDPRYFRLTGGIERWLWRLVRKHVGRQSTGWEIALAALHARSGSMSRPSDFVTALRRIAQRGTLLDYRIEMTGEGRATCLRAVRNAERIPSAGRVPVEKRGNLSTKAGCVL